MLHHGHIAGVRLFFNIEFVLLDIGKFDLLVFLGIRIDRWPGEG
jgi:hypothetical protein